MKKLYFAAIVAGAVLAQVPNPPQGAQNAAKGAPSAATVPPQPVKFALSDVENLRLELLQSRRRELNLRLEVLSNDSKALNGDIEAYRVTTLRAHGEPKGVVFDPQSLTFQVLNLAVENTTDKK